MSFSDLESSVITDEGRSDRLNPSSSPSSSSTPTPTPTLYKRKLCVGRNRRSRKLGLPYALVGFVAILGGLVSYESYKAGSFTSSDDEEHQGSRLVYAPRRLDGSPYVHSESPLPSSYTFDTTSPDSPFLRILSDSEISLLSSTSNSPNSTSNATHATQCHVPILTEKSTKSTILAALGIAWSFVGLAIVCDEFFQASLERLSEALSLSPDVAGATFLAAGSSAPELFTSMADAFGDESSIGMGTIVGSAMFNILVIVALSAAVAGKAGSSLSIDYRPVTRDVCFYLYSIVILAIFFDDGKIVLYESLIMWMSYLAYIGFMVKNEMFLGMCKPPAHGEGYKVSPGDEESVNSAAATIEGIGGGAGADATTQPGSPATEEEEEEGGSRFELPGSAGEWPLYIISFPILVLFTLTIPDCGSKRFERFFVMTFIMSILWIGVLCHIMVELAIGIACINSIDPIIMGVLVLAVGTSVPDAIGSMIAARNGEADMAIANAVGSNVFDVLLGLGLPWFLSTIIKKRPFPVCKDGIYTAVVILLCTAILFVMVLAANKWQMNTNIGFALFFLYILYVLYTLLTANDKGC